MFSSYNIIIAISRGFKSIIVRISHPFRIYCIQHRTDRIKQNYMDKYRCKDKEVKKSMRQDKRKWVDHLAMEAEEAAHNGRMKEVYDITKNPQ